MEGKKQSKEIRSFCYGSDERIRERKSCEERQKVGLDVHSEI